MSMKTIIIGNPNSGRAKSGDHLERYAKILGSQGAEVEVWPTEYPQHATELATRAGTCLVVAAGGDGTVNEVINGLESDATLGILPLGTANVLARELGLPRNPEQACQRILADNRSRIDLGLATDREGMERRFSCMAGIGFDATVVRTVTPRLKRYLRVLAFPLIAFKVYFDEEMPAVHITHDGETHNTQSAIIANGQYYGGDFRVTRRRDSLTSGVLETVLIERVSMLLRPDIMARYLARDPLSKSMHSFSANELRAYAPGGDVPVQLDGEVWGRLPMSFRIEPEALRVIR